MKIKTLAVSLVALLSASVCLARPGGGHHSGGIHRGGGFHGGSRHCAPRGHVPHVRHGGWHHSPPPRYHHHHRHHRYYGGGYWPGFVGGVIGGAAIAPVIESETVVVTQPTVVEQPVIVQQPVVQQAAATQNVWVEGRYVDQLQADGTTTRVWQPGHYEQVPVQ